MSHQMQNVVQQAKHIPQQAQNTPQQAQNTPQQKAHINIAQEYVTSWQERSIAYKQQQIEQPGQNHPVPSHQFQTATSVTTVEQTEKVQRQTDSQAGVDAFHKGHVAQPPVNNAHVAHTVDNTSTTQDEQNNLASPTLQVTEDPLVHPEVGNSYSTVVEKLEFSLGEIIATTDLLSVD